MVICLGKSQPASLAQSTYKLRALLALSISASPTRPRVATTNKKPGGRLLPQPASFLSLAQTQTTFLSLPRRCVGPDDHILAKGTQWKSSLAASTFPSWVCPPDVSSQDDREPTYRRHSTSITPQLLLRAEAPAWAPTNYIVQWHTIKKYISTGECV